MKDSTVKGDGNPGDTQAKASDEHVTTSGAQRPASTNDPKIDPEVSGETYGEESDVVSILNVNDYQIEKYSLSRIKSFNKGQIADAYYRLQTLYGDVLKDLSHLQEILRRDTCIKFSFKSDRSVYLGLPRDKKPDTEPLPDGAEKEGHNPEEPVLLERILPEQKRRELPGEGRVSQRGAMT